MTLLRCAALVAAPAAVLLFALANPLTAAFFPKGDMDMTAALLRACSPGVLAYGMAVVLGCVLWSMGEKRAVLVALFLSVAAGCLASIGFLARPDSSLRGLAWGNLICGLALCLLFHFYLQLRLGMRLNWLRVLLAPCIGALLAGGAGALAARLLGNSLNAVPAAILSLLLGMILYLIVEVVLQGITTRELNEFPGGDRLASALHRMRIL